MRVDEGQGSGRDVEHLLALKGFIFGLVFSVAIWATLGIVVVKLVD